MPLDIETPLTPKGDQPKAIAKLVEGINKGYQHQTLLGVTGSGKTFTMASVIDKIKKPTLIIGPNKTLVAQLFGEFKTLFPSAAVCYYVSFYDYYQPEAYLPSKDLYIEKDVDINREIERLRHTALEALATRDDVIVCASVSCIYGTGPPDVYRSRRIALKVGDSLDRQDLMLELVKNQYERNDVNLDRKTFRVRGDSIDIFPLYGDYVYRIEFFGDEIERLTSRHSVTGEMMKEYEAMSIYPGTQYLANDAFFESALEDIKIELDMRLAEFEKDGKVVERHRLRQKTLYDLELLRETGGCSGIENYSRHFDRRKPGEKPFALLDHFPEDFLFIIDESHLTIPQLRGMYGGDYSRKKNLIEHGFRLPSAFDNRPFRFEETEKYMHNVVFTSATPRNYEYDVSEQIVEQIIRPTGLVDPKIDVRGTDGQITGLVSEINQRVSKGERVLVTTITKKSAEMLSDYLLEMNIKSVYLHHEVDTLDRIEILRELRLGKYDVVVGINLLREGLDLPEVALVAILDADKEGFLRSKGSLIQLMGRASRNVHGSVILYADNLTDSMKEAITENNRRRRIQQEYNEKHGIKPTTIRKEIRSIVETLMQIEPKEEERIEVPDDLTSQDILYVIDDLKEKMAEAAGALDFEKAALYRDKIKELEKMVETR
ncbi:MAG: excinuclease ABC subunit UvrB [Candidatus Heimdallarchaeota archaeon]|nr:excinuclease ABC subunit UvrB [Candidatus Heimdallarchaeota archaeon]MCK5142410.1 excinuclease ABC subunit UvrB [Candidatus Heimdallarchaeota archaeon]